MLNIQFCGENICNPLDGQMDKLIESFVAVHGEDKRDKIAERLNSTTFFFLPRSFDDMNAVKEKLYNTRKQLSVDFFNEVGVTGLCGVIGVEELFVVKENFEYRSFNSYTIKLLNKICKALLIRDELKEYREKNGMQGNKDGREFVECEEVYNRLKEFFLKAEEIDNVQCFRDRENEAVAEYSKISQGYDYLKEIKHNETIKRDKRKNVVIEEKVAQLLRFQNVEQLHKAYTRDRIGDLMESYQRILSRGRENFADEMTLTNQTKEDFLSLFNEMGVPRKSNLSQYAESKTLMDLIFDESVMQKLSVIDAECENEMARKNPFFQDAVKRIKALDINGGDMQFVSNVYRYMAHNNMVKAMVFHYLTSNNEVRAICILPLSTHLERDTLAHECEHIVESSGVLENEDILIKCGLEAHSYEVDDESYDGNNLRVDDKDGMEKEKQPREFEILNETMTQMFAYLVCEEADKVGFNVGSPEHSTTWHMKMVRLFNPLFEFTKDLSDVRILSDRSLFEKRFGKVNVMLMQAVAARYYQLLKNNLQYGDFLMNMRNYTGERLEDIDFLNLPVNLKLSAGNASFLEQHVLLAKVVANLKKEKKLQGTRKIFVQMKVLPNNKKRLGKPVSFVV